jgi:hypothetical protein
MGKAVPYREAVAEKNGTAQYIIVVYCAGGLINPVFTDWKTRWQKSSR